MLGPSTTEDENMGGVLRTPINASPHNRRSEIGSHIQNLFSGEELPWSNCSCVAFPGFPLVLHAFLPWPDFNLRAKINLNR